MSYLSSMPAPAGRTPQALIIPGFAAVALAAGMRFPAAAHDAKPTAAMPQGWSYPFSCCSGYDCREVSSEADQREAGRLCHPGHRRGRRLFRRTPEEFARRRISLVLGRRRGQYAHHLPVCSAAFILNTSYILTRACQSPPAVLPWSGRNRSRRRPWRSREAATARRLLSR